jgi:uncharacterized membrane protein
MTYSQGNLIQASDYNTFVGTTGTTTANTLNATWSTGGGAAGYGQSAVSQIAAGNTILAATWNALINDINNAGLHQGTILSPTNTAVAGGTIAYTSSISTNLQNIYTNRLNASGQGTFIPTVTTFNSTWSNSLTFTFTASFANGDAARYFFNAGGQIDMTCSHPAGAGGLNPIVSQLATNVGNVILSSPISGTTNITGINYSGILKFNGGGNPPSPYLTNNGYYALTTSNAAVFQQTATGSSYPNYLGTNIALLIKSNGTQGTNGDAGSVITMTAVWTEVASGGSPPLPLSSGTNTTFTLRYPQTSFIANTWGAVTVSGTVIGS